MSSNRPSRERTRVRRVLFAALLLTSTLPLSAQVLPNLEPERPLAVEDATPIPFHALSAAVDWTYNLRRGGLNDQGPGFCGAPVGEGWFQTP